MTNIEAGSQRIRRLPDKPIVGETYPNAGGLYKVDRYDAECDLAFPRSLRQTEKKTQPAVNPATAC